MAQSVLMDTNNSAAEGPELAEPYLREVLGTAGLAVEYVRAEGNTLYQRGADGGEIPVADFAGGYGSVLLGHNHPDIVRCAQELLAAGTPVHAQFSRHPYANRLASELNRIIHRELGTDEPYFAIFANTGAEAVEAAVKHAEMDRVMRIAALREELERSAGAARDAVAAGGAAVADRALRRFGLAGKAAPAETLAELERHLAERNAAQLERPPLFLALEGGFHGKLGTSVQLTHNEHYRTPFRALAAQARFVPRDRPEALKEIHAQERGVVFELTVDGGQVDVVEREFPVFCAFLVEPIQGEGGIHVLEAGFAEAIQRFCAEIDCPVIVDEIQSGMGRTGSFLASTRLGLRGDYYTLAKSLGGGIAKVSALLIRRSRHRGEFELIHSSTFAKDGFSSRIALKVLDLIESDGKAVYRLAAERGERLKDMLRAVHKDHPEVVKDVRGRGLMLGLELHDQSNAPAEPVRQAARDGLFGYLIAGHLLRAHRIRTFPTASAVNTLRFEPSVYLTDTEIEQLETALRDTCDIIDGGYRRPLDLPAPA